MTLWTAIVPLKAEAARKSRLSPALTPERRVMLAEQLYVHVIGCVLESRLFSRVVIVSPTPPPGDFAVDWRPDADAPINDTLAQLREPAAGMMVINADLPLLEVDDLKALAASAEAQGSALAPDRHGTGTNALGVMPGTDFTFAFGHASLTAHRGSAPLAGIVERRGLAYDIDRVEDIDAVLALGDIADSVRALLQLRDLPAGAGKA